MFVLGTHLMLQWFLRRRRSGAGACWPERRSANSGAPLHTQTRAMTTAPLLQQFCCNPDNTLAMQSLPSDCVLDKFWSHFDPTDFDRFLLRLSSKQRAKLVALPIRLIKDKLLGRIVVEKCSCCSHRTVSRSAAAPEVVKIVDNLLDPRVKMSCCDKEPFVLSGQTVSLASWRKAALTTQQMIESIQTACAALANESCLTCQHALAVQIVLKLASFDQLLAAFHQRTCTVHHTKL